MNESGSTVPPTIDADDPRIAAARPFTLESADLARLELALLGAWPFPFEVAASGPASADATLALRNAEGVIFALLEPSATNGAIGERLRLVRRPRHPDFPELRATPDEVRTKLRGATNIGAFFADGPLDALLAARLAATLPNAGDALLVFVSIDSPPAGDLAHHLRIRAIEAAVRRVGRGGGNTQLVLVPEAEAKDRDESALRAAIAAAYGANRLYVDGAPADSASTRSGITLSALPASAQPLADWTPIDALLARAKPPLARQGFTVWFTGLSQAGKSTIATRLSRLLLDHGRASTLLDGDVVRTHLSKGLSFSREDRDTNIRRLGYVAGEITRHGGVALVAAISPYRAIRAENRARIGNYVEVFVNAPVETCEARDQKGQYAKARRGEIKGFTGVDDPYEPPRPGDPEVIECRTDRESAAESAQRVFDHLVRLGYVDPADSIA